MYRTVPSLRFLTAKTRNLLWDHVQNYQKTGSDTIFKTNIFG